MGRKKQQTASPTSLLISIIVVLFLGIVYTCRSSTPAPEAQQDTTVIDSVAQHSVAAEPVPEVSVRGNDSLLVQTLPDGVKSLMLQRAGYVTSYNAETRLPNYVAWNLTADRTEGPAQRKGLKFEEDTDVPAPRADNWDYYNSGYDRGHMCPAADNKWSEQAMHDSFLYTNCCPQNGNLNRGDWNEMEVACRTWARRYGSIYIVAGPLLLNQKHATIGDHKVVVPEAFFKVVLCLEGTPKGIGFIYRNTNGDRPKDAYVNSIRDVERITGITFFPSLDPEVAAKVKSQHRLSDW